MARTSLGTYCLKPCPAAPSTSPVKMRTPLKMPHPQEGSSEPPMPTGPTLATNPHAAHIHQRHALEGRHSVTRWRQRCRRRVGFQGKARTNASGGAGHDRTAHHHKVLWIVQKPGTHASHNLDVQP